MIDAFAELDLPRSPVVDDQALAERFDMLSRTRHPDAGGQSDDFARLTEARRILSSPALRWRHLLELDHPGTRLHGPLSPALVDLFATLGPSLQSSQDLLRRKAAATTSLSRALLAPQELRLREALEAAAARLTDGVDALSVAAGSWDGTANTLATWAREAAFLEKWLSQVRNQLAQLSL